MPGPDETLGNWWQKNGEARDTGSPGTVLRRESRIQPHWGVEDKFPNQTGQATQEKAIGTSGKEGGKIPRKNLSH